MFSKTKVRRRKAKTKKQLKQTVALFHFTQIAMPDSSHHKTYATQHSIVIKDQIQHSALFDCQLFANYYFLQIEKDMLKCFKFY